MRKFKRLLSRVLYSLLFEGIDKENIYFFAFIGKFKNRINYQKFYGKLHYTSLQGLNYMNNDPLTNGEYFIIKLLSERLANKQNLIIIDCGSNIGDYAREIYKVFVNKSIHCFEPSADTFNELKNNTKDLNGIVYNKLGIGDSVKEVVLHKNKDISALASVYQRNLNHLHIELDLTESIKITTLDDYCEMNKIKNIDILKLDVEGNEYNSFLGARKLLSEKRINYIQFEMGGCNIDSKVFWKDIFYLLNPNYRIYRIIGDGLVEFTYYDEVHEIFVYSNYFAEKR